MFHRVNVLIFIDILIDVYEETIPTNHKIAVDNESKI